MMRENLGSFRVPEKIYFKKGCLPVALEELKYIQNCKKVLIVTNSGLQKQGKLKLITDKLNELGIVSAVQNVSADGGVGVKKAAAASVRKAANVFKPDCILIFGSDEEIFLILNAMSLNIQGKKVYFIIVPCFVGMCSQVQITSDMVIIDTDLMDNVPDVIRWFVRGALDQAVNACDSYRATDYSDSMAMQAIHLIFEYFPKVLENPDHAYAMEKLASAGTMAGIAFFNARSIHKSENHARCAELLGMDSEIFTQKLEDFYQLYLKFN